MMKNIYLLLIAFAIFSIQSCTIEKRRYMDGYHVEWNHRSDRHVILDKDVTDHEEVNPATEVSEMAESTTFSSNPVDEKVSPPQKNVTDQKVEKSKKVRTTSMSKPRETNIGTRHHSEPVAAPSASLSFEETNQTDVNMLVLIILAVLVSPIAMYLYQGTWNTECWISLILYLLFWLPGVIYTLIVILG